MNKPIVRLSNEISHYRRTHPYLFEVAGIAAGAEISIHPADYYDLMDDPEIHANYDPISPERNFRGIPIVFDGDLDRPVVRDRTRSK